MDMYTDWGNLKVVSCGAWLEGPDPAAQRRIGGMGALGASILTLTGQMLSGLPGHGNSPPVQLGDAGKFRYSSICF